MRPTISMILIFAVAISGCVDNQEDESNSSQEPEEPDQQPEWINVTASQAVSANTCAGPGVCTVGRSDHGLGDIDNMTLTRLTVEVEWEPPEDLCDKLEAIIMVFGSDTSGEYYLQSGASPIRFELTNLTIPLASSQSEFLRLSIGPEHYETPAGRIYANDRIEYEIQMDGLVRPTVADDAVPELSWEEPHMQGPVSHCQE